MESYYIGGGRVLKIVVGIAVLALLLTGSANAKTLTVNASGGADYTTIKDAINNSNNGDTILVHSGTYFENVDVNKQLILKGVDTGGGKPVVDGRRESSTIFMSESNSTLEGFTVVNSSTDFVGSGIFIDSPNNLLKDNSATNNNYGIYLVFRYNNTLVNNSAMNNNYGISLSESVNNTLNNNTVSNNKYMGIDLSESDDNMLINNNASNNNYGIYLSDSSYNLLKSNNVSNNIYGIYLWSFPYAICDCGPSNNTIYNNIFNNINNFVINNSHSYFKDSNIWNTTRQSGTNIIGGSYLGGNFWAYPNGTGFSQTCSDSNKDGICDSPNILDSNNTDYLPLSVTSQAHDILSYYRSLGTNPNVVETTDLLKAADDWSRNIVPPGFSAPITTQQLLILADEWSKGE
jgi:parallel beta-helix repeat protein